MSAVQQTGLFDEARSLLSEFRGLAKDRVRLAALETQAAGQSAVRMLIAGVAAAVLLISAWLALVAAGVAALVAYTPLGAVPALAIAAGANLLAAGVAYLAIKRMARALGFPRTVGSLQ